LGCGLGTTLASTYQFNRFTIFLFVVASAQESFGFRFIFWNKSNEVK
jgi:hypothetical protein